MKSAPRKTAAALAEEIAKLDGKVNALLPPRYQHCYSTVSPTSMGSAGLRYGADGKVLWDQIWTSFCDLALAGGPPHRGTYLEPVSETEVEAEPQRYRTVVAELHRAIHLTTGLSVVDGYASGWLGVKCASANEAAWIQFAVTAENVCARRAETVLQLPAGPSFRVEKEIKNVVVALAKACHYWDGHLTAAQQTLAGASVSEAATPAEVAANQSAYESVLDALATSLQSVGLPLSPRRYTGWFGIETASDEDAVWLLRAVLVEQVMARREENMLYLPVSATSGLDQADQLGRIFLHACELREAAATQRRPAWRPSRRPN